MEKFKCNRCKQRKATTETQPWFNPEIYGGILCDECFDKFKELFLKLNNNSDGNERIY